MATNLAYPPVPPCIFGYPIERMQANGAKFMRHTFGIHVQHKKNPIDEHAEGPGSDCVFLYNHGLLEYPDCQLQFID